MPNSLENIKLVSNLTPSIIKYKLQQSWGICFTQKKKKRAPESCYGDKGISDIDIVWTIYFAATFVYTICDW